MTSRTLTKARARARRHGWDPAWIRAEVDARAVLDAGCYFDPAAAARVIKFFTGVLRHTDTSTGTVGPFTLMPWQEHELLAPLFGWKRRDGTRRYRRGGVWVPKKNGKSTMAAGLELYLLVGDQEPGAEVYCLDPSTRVLDTDLRWRAVSDFQVGQTVVGFDEHGTPQSFRKLRVATVTSTKRIIQPCFRIGFSDGRSVIASAWHRWLAKPNGKSGFKTWVQTRDLEPGRSAIRDIGLPWADDHSREAGYLAGVFDGEGCFHRSKKGEGYRIAFAQKPGLVLETTRRYLTAKGFDISECRKHKSGVDTFEVRGLSSCLRLLGQIRPHRLFAEAQDWWTGKAPNRNSRETDGHTVVTSLEYIGDREVIAIGTSTQTLFAEGFFSHNSAANDRRQAGIIHGHAVRMIELSPILLRQITPRGIVRSTKTIVDAKTGSTFVALSADAPRQEGVNIHGLVVDEIHAMRSRVLWDTLVYGGASRRQPLILSISTAGVYDVMSIGWEQYTYARDIARGLKDEDWSFFPLIYEAPPEADWTDPAVHRAANPSYGVTVRIDTLTEECTEAQAEPRKESTFRRYRLNQWTNQVTRWIPMEQWAANHGHPVTRAALAGSVAYGGLDLGAVSDLTAYALLCPCPHDPGAVDVLMRFWVPEDALRDPTNRNAIQYQLWAKTVVDGLPLLETTAGAVTDYDVIEAAILADAQQFEIRAVGIDRLFQGQQVSNHLLDHGVPVVAIGQNFIGQTPPMKEFERLWRAGRLHHGGHPILRWMADNVEIKQAPPDLMKISKPNSAHDPRKVDGIQAIVNGVDQLARAVVVPEVACDIFVLGAGG